MGLRKMLLLLAVGFVAVLALCLYVFVVETGAPTTEEALKARSLVFRIQDEKNRTIRDLATRVEIRRGEEAVLLEKASAQEWRLKKPVDARADRSAVLSLLDTLAGLRIEVDPITPKAEELAKFGLDKPRFAATFWLGDQAHPFAVGSEVKGQKTWEKRAYLRIGDEPRVFVVSNDLAEKLAKGVEKLEKPEDGAKWAAAFRDKRVFERTRDPEKATALRVVGKERTLELARAEKAWELRSPVTDLADPSKVSSLLSKARNLEVEKFISEDATKLAEYGLDKPQLTAELKAEDGTLMTLLIGGEAPEKDHLYAKRGEEPSIFTIKKEFLTDIEPKLEDIRDRKVANFDDSDVTAVEVAVAGKDIWAAAREGKDKDWRLSKPRDAAAYQSGLGDVLRHAGRLRIARWIDDPKDPAHEHLKEPAATLTLRREPKGKPGATALPPITLHFSAPIKTEKPKPAEPKKPAEPGGDKDKKAEDEKPKEPEFEEGRYVRREGQAGILYVLAGKAPDGAAYYEKDSVEAINWLAECFGKGHLAVLDRKVFDFKQDAVTRLTIERDSARLVAEKKDGDWKLTAPVSLDADKSNVSSILGAMNDLAADDYVAENPQPDDLKRYGLDTPELRITAAIEEEAQPKPEPEKKDAPKSAEKKTVTKTLLVSRKLDGKTYGMEQGGTLVFTLKSWDADSLRSELISMTLGDFAEADATSLTIAHRGKPEVVLEKEKDVWAITKPKKAEADQDAVKKVLDALHDLKARRCLDYEGKDLAAHGLDSPETTITVKIKDKPDLVLKLGKPLPDEKDAPGSPALKGDAKQVYLVPKTKVEDISKSLSDLEKKPEPPKEEPKKDAPKADEPKKDEAKPPDAPKGDTPAPTDKPAPPGKKAGEK